MVVDRFCCQSSIKLVVDISRYCMPVRLFNRDIEPQDKVLQDIETALNRGGRAVPSLQVPPVVDDRVGYSHRLFPFL